MVMPIVGGFRVSNVADFYCKTTYKTEKFFGFLMITNSNGGAFFDFLIQISFHRNVMEFAASHYYIIYFKTLS